MKRLFFIITLLLFGLYTGSAFAAYQDLTTFSETDPNSRIAVTASRVTVSSLTRNESAYLVKDFGAGYFGDFPGANAHLVDVRVTAGVDYGLVVIWGISNTLGQAQGWANGLFANFYRIAGQYSIEFHETGGSSQSYNISVNTTYYLAIERGGTSATCKIYSDSSRTSLLATLSIAVSATTYRYFYAVSSWNSSGPTYTISGYGENYSLGNRQNVLQGGGLGDQQTPMGGMW